MVHAGLSAHHAPQHCWAINWAAIYEEILKQVLLGCLTPLKLPPRCEPPMISTMQACLTISQATSAPLPSRTWQLAILSRRSPVGCFAANSSFKLMLKKAGTVVKKGSRTSVSCADEHMVEPACLSNHQSVSLQSQGQAFARSP
jgi:hypothetical protein